ncbi:hypothetical protein SAMN04488531_0195 [Corynebacterium coyleae]|uniref:Uncharacterized protein n=1 Tax=Corynebacterium coyleae TaxID=53374 RepID=A0ABX8KXW1_9CORY|nr:hypothetical protein [Corynebacterium coyleae]QXB18683.1 hypothetical protein I6L55_00705 [Corynebacterium coyleae]WJY80210.1 hypothetical protein CCOY_08085 [Corynebacterium coyleae]SEB39375.1 hypothetical protein SAMN04488531_0195 [Corynebacterium coyleae]
MKRISSAMVAAATALTLAVTPAYAEDAKNTGNEATDTHTTAPVDQPEDNKGETDKPGEGETDKPGETEQPGKGEDNKDETNNPPAPQKQTSGSSQGHIIGAVSGTLAAVLTTGLIVFSDPRGINKIIDALNREFHLGIPHVHVPQVQLPKLPF